MPNLGPNLLYTFGQSVIAQMRLDRPRLGRGRLGQVEAAEMGRRHFKVGKGAVQRHVVRLLHATDVQQRVHYLLRPRRAAALHRR